MPGCPPRVLRALLVTALVAVAGCGGASAPTAPPALATGTTVPTLRPEVVAELPHDPAAFTQGFEMDDGVLYEGTGLQGRSQLRELDPDTGAVRRAVLLPGQLFGEGITVVGDRIWQLTWRDGVALEWDRATLTLRREVPLVGEGWGLCDDSGPPDGHGGGPPDGHGSGPPDGHGGGPPDGHGGGPPDGHGGGPPDGHGGGPPDGHGGGPPDGHGGGPPDGHGGGPPDGHGGGPPDGHGVRLIRSDGTDRLRFHDPVTFAEQGSVAVTLDGAPVNRLNELECVGGQVWANVWQTDRIVRIDPATGQITAVVDASGLLAPAHRAGADVLNGIAAVPGADGEFLVTGKLWPATFRVRFVE